MQSPSLSLAHNHFSFFFFIFFCIKFQPKPFPRPRLPGFLSLAGDSSHESASAAALPCEKQIPGRMDAGTLSPSPPCFLMRSHKPLKKTSSRQLVVGSRAGGRWERILAARATESIPPSGCPLCCHGWPWVPFPPLSHALAGWSLWDVTPPPLPHFQRDGFFIFSCHLLHARQPFPLA